MTETDRITDAILTSACRDVIATSRLGRRIGRTVPTANLAARLSIAAEEVALLLPEEPAHGGRCWAMVA